MIQLRYAAVRNGLRLSFGCRRTEDEVIGDRRQFTHGKNVEIDGFLIERCCHRHTDTTFDGIRHVWTS